MGPKNKFNHTSNDKHKQVSDYTGGASGISIVSVTMEDRDKVDRFIKRLFSKALIAQAELNTGSMQREYLQYGNLQATNEKLLVELTTADAKVPDLINFINAQNPNEYDYPVTDVQVEAVDSGDSSYFAWVKA